MRGNEPALGRSLARSRGWSCSAQLAGADSQTLISTGVSITAQAIELTLRK